MIGKDTNDVVGVSVFASAQKWNHLIDCPLGDRFWKPDIFEQYPGLPTNACGVLDLKVFSNLNESAPQQWLKADVMRLDFDKGVFVGFVSRSPKFESVIEAQDYLEDKVLPNLREKVGQFVCLKAEGGKPAKIEFVYEGDERVLEIRVVGTIDRAVPPKSVYHLTFHYRMKDTDSSAGK